MEYDYAVHMIKSHCYLGNEQNSVHFNCDWCKQKANVMVQASDDHLYSHIM